MPHTRDVTVLALHHEGNIILSGDSGGTFMLHMLVAPQVHSLPAVCKFTCQMGFLLFMLSGDWAASCIEKAVILLMMHEGCEQ